MSTWAPCCSIDCSCCSREEPFPSAGSPCWGWRSPRGRWRRGGSASRWTPSRGCCPPTPPAPPSNQGRAGSGWPRFQPLSRRKFKWHETNEGKNCGSRNLIKLPGLWFPCFIKFHFCHHRWSLLHSSEDDDFCDGLGMLSSHQKVFSIKDCSRHQTREVNTL